MIIPIILCGGSGTRLWPLSRKSYPKQFLPLSSDKTLFQESLIRVSDRTTFKAPIIICNEMHRFIVGSQSSELNVRDATILIEPTARNTAPAITAAVLSNKKYSEEDIFLVLSSDHFIEDNNKLLSAVRNGIELSRKGLIVAFGVRPSEPNENYGYIEFTQDEEDKFEFKSFIEKPKLKEAKKLFNEKKYLWNCGIFMFKKGTFINEIKSFSPEIYFSVKESLNKSTFDLDFLRLDEEIFKKCPNISIDYALLEKTKNIGVVKLASNWSDLGTWQSLYNFKKKDSNGNVIEGDVIEHNSINSLIISPNRLTVTYGIENLFVVNTSDLTFIFNRNNSSSMMINTILSDLSNQRRKEKSDSEKCYRPWGWFESLLNDCSFQVKRLHINPKSKLSLQYHMHRSEHWVVVKGIAKVYKGEDFFILKKGDSIYIPKEEKHSITNETSEELIIIEIQSGNYLGEDDIVRLEDIYGRIKES